MKPLSPDELAFLMACDSPGTPCGCEQGCDEEEIDDSQQSALDAILETRPDLIEEFQCPVDGGWHFNRSILGDVAIEATLAAAKEWTP